MWNTVYYWLYPEEKKKQGALQRLSELNEQTNRLAMDGHIKINAPIGPLDMKTLSSYNLDEINKQCNKQEKVISASKDIQLFNKIYSRDEGCKPILELRSSILLYEPLQLATELQQFEKKLEFIADGITEFEQSNSVTVPSFVCLTCFQPINEHGILCLSKEAKDHSKEEEEKGQKPDAISSINIFSHLVSNDSSLSSFCYSSSTSSSSSSFSSSIQEKDQKCEEKKTEITITEQQ